MELLNKVKIETSEGTQKEPRSERLSSMTMKVQLPLEVIARVQNALHILKERKADVKADELLADFLGGISDKYLRAQIERKTPDDYYFEMARTIPDLREQIIKKARASMNHRLSERKGITLLNPKKRTRKKLDITHPEVNPENPVQAIEV